MGCGVITRLAEELGVDPTINVLEDVSKNFSGAGVSVKVIPLKKGQIVIQHKHSYDHLSILLSGVVVLKNDDLSTIMDATNGPISVVVKADKYHSLVSVEDSVWVCVHQEGQNVIHSVSN